MRKYLELINFKKMPLQIVRILDIICDKLIECEMLLFFEEYDQQFKPETKWKKGAPA